MLHAQTSSFNLSLVPITVSGWTNLSGDPSLAVRTVTDASTGFGLTSVATQNWVQFSGACAQDTNGATTGTFFPAAVMENNWYQYGTLANYNAAVPQLKLTGLKVDSFYTIKMTASFTGTSLNPNPTQYTVSGKVVAGFVDLPPHNNTSNGATFYNVNPDSSGSISIFVNTTSTTNDALICGVKVITGRTGPTPTIVIASPANNAILPEDGNVIFAVSATETGGSIQKVDYYNGTTLIGTSTTAPFGFTWVDPNVGQYSVKAIATDSLGTTATATMSLTVESLNYFWSTTGNIKTSGDTFFVGTVDTNRLAFRTNNVERMTILKDGTIGIGTKTTYGYALAVNGTAIFTKAKVKTAGTWPDYVFKPNYALPDLKDLERYVKEHQHLPDFAPEKTVQREGIDIAEQQAALLKKVEELTLYLIQQNKKIEAQQKEIDELKARIKTKQ